MLARGKEIRELLRNVFVKFGAGQFDQMFLGMNNEEVDDVDIVVGKRFFSLGRGCV